MALPIRLSVNEDRKKKLNAIDKVVDANKTTIRQRIMDEGIDALHAKLFSTQSVIDSMKVVGNDEFNA